MNGHDALRDLISEVAGAAEPAARVVHSAAVRPRRAAVLPGAFNPPTSAHLALARAARERGFDVVAFALATRTIDKEDAGGLAIEERLALLRQVAEGDERLGVVVQNRGLYAEQALAIRSAWPALEELVFVVGMDKVEQIFDARYYDDYERSLETLFREARLLVAARGTLDRSALARLIEREPAQRHAAKIDWLELDPRWLELSATAVRERLLAGELPEDSLPAPVAGYLREHPERFRRDR